jgi:hypothetical protein
MGTFEFKEDHETVLIYCNTHTNSIELVFPSHCPQD